MFQLCYFNPWNHTHVNEKKTIQNGFEVAGLVPFDPEEIDYNVLHKKSKEKKKDETIPKADLDHEPQSPLV